MDIEKLAERCMVAESCLPDAPYRTQLCKLHQEMLDEIASLRAEVEALRVDAERYRYIVDARKVYVVTIRTQPSGDVIYNSNGRGLDAAIDAARGKVND